MIKTLMRLAAEEDGADSTEYALLAALVAVALIGGATFLGGKLNDIFNGMGNRLNTVTIP